MNSLVLGKGATSNDGDIAAERSRRSAGAARQASVIPRLTRIDRAVRDEPVAHSATSSFTDCAEVRASATPPDASDLGVVAGPLPVRHGTRGSVDDVPSTDRLHSRGRGAEQISRMSQHVAARLASSIRSRRIINGARPGGGRLAPRDDPR
jgi:hypothetical protein